MSGVNSNHSENLAIVAGTVDGTPRTAASVTAGNGFYVDGTGTGVYSIVLDRAYQKIISCVITTKTAGAVGSWITPGFTPGEVGGVITVSTANAAGALADADFSIVVCLEVADA